jgi:hypothetical protein
MGAITALVGTALTLGAASTAAGTGIGALSLASTIGAAAVGAGAFFGGKMLLSSLSGGKDQGGGQMAAPGFDTSAQSAAAADRATEETKRRRVAVAKNKTLLNDPNKEATLGTTGLLGGYG